MYVLDPRVLLGIVKRASIFDDVKDKFQNAEATVRTPGVLDEVRDKLLNAKGSVGYRGESRPSFKRELVNRLHDIETGYTLAMKKLDPSGALDPMYAGWPQAKRMIRLAIAKAGKDALDTKDSIQDMQGRVNRRSDNPLDLVGERINRILRTR